MEGFVNVFISLKGTEPLQNCTIPCNFLWRGIAVYSRGHGKSFSWSSTGASTPCGSVSFLYLWIV